MFLYSIYLIIQRILINELIKQGLYMDKNKIMYIWKWCTENCKYGSTLPEIIAKFA